MDARLCRGGCEQELRPDDTWYTPDCVSGLLAYIVHYMRHVYVPVDRGLGAHGRNGVSANC